MQRSQYRQGDVVVENEAVPGYPQVATFSRWGVGAQHKTGTTKSHVLADGEKTGHQHVLESEQEFELYEKDGTLFMKLPAEAKLTHPEHAEITVPAGEYRVVRQMEYDPKAQGRQRPVLD